MVHTTGGSEKPTEENAREFFLFFTFGSPVTRKYTPQVLTQPLLRPGLLSPLSSVAKTSTDNSSS